MADEGGEPSAAPVKVRELERRVLFNSGPENAARCKEVKASLDNHIVTYKYNLLTFLPINLFEQFSRVANSYFLVLLILQLIPAVSSLSPVTTAVPLIFVLAVTAFKDAADDYKRHTSDRAVNSRPTLVLRDGVFVEEVWSKVVVGDMLKITSDRFIPADVMLIATSHEHGECFVETAELDGETNLKVRRSLPATKDLRSDAQISAFRARLVCEPPNNRLHKFEGTLELGGEQIPVGLDNVLLRGCTLRNTEWVTGIVVFAGPDTKLMQNSGATRFKRTHVDKLMNRFVFTIFAILIVICAIAAILCSWWEHKYGNDFRIYFQRPSFLPDNPDGIAALSFFSYIIVLNTLVPISLYVSVEIIRLGQSLLINWDVAMYHRETDCPAQARTTTLNEELGQIDYVFSDKTGTLTQNVMNFLKCSVGGTIYGKEPVEGQPYAGFISDNLRAALDGGQADVADFFRLLSLCHTVQPEVINGRVVYQAQSPDEKALADAAREAGFVFESRTNQHINITDSGRRQSYQLLNIIEFNSTRKRMTVVLRRPDNRVFVYSKGADNIMFERLSQRSHEAAAHLKEHLHVFAKDGLRTLVLAQRELSDDFYVEWARRYNEAETSLEDREGKSSLVAEEIERDLDLVGASAIEDQLQANVPSTIANLKAAMIKVWVLTGDKQETAINIGASCRLLTADMEPLLIVNGSSMESVRGQLERHLEAITRDGPNHRPYGLVIDGPSLVFPLPPEAREKRTATEVGADGVVRKKWTETRLKQQEDLESIFVDVATQCSAVVCCRVSPLQKAQVVQLIKKRRKAITLAIGDGANDVSMIKAAHVGVGISGLEGRQAVLASDYAIAQFRFLERLLLVHGHWSYVRMCSFLRYFFYKNFAFTLLHFWYAFFCAYSAQAVLDQVFIALFNVVFTSLPILVVGIFEQDVSAADTIRYPILYEAGPKNALFSYAQFVVSLCRGGLHSIIIFFVALCAFRIGGQFEAGFQTQSDLFSFGTVLSVTLIFVVTLTLTIDIKYFTWVIWLMLALGPVVWLCMFAALYNWNDYFFQFQSEYFGSFNHVFQSQTFWATFFLSIALCNLPVFVYHFYCFRFRPTPIDEVRRLVADHKPPRESRGQVPPAPNTHEMTGYAFSQEDHVGRDLFPNTVVRAV